MKLYARHLGGYMRRWVLQTPWGTVRLHNIRKSDEGRDMHDHPFHFVSLILKGGYTEHRPGCECASSPLGLTLNQCRTYGAGSIVRRKATDLHRLELTSPAWTLVITSRYSRRWGFQTARGWVDYAEYERSYYAKP